MEHRQRGDGGNLERDERDAMTTEQSNAAGGKSILGRLQRVLSGVRGGSKRTPGGTPRSSVKTPSIPQQEIFFEGAVGFFISSEACVFDRVRDCSEVWNISEAF